MDENGREDFQWSRIQCELLASEKVLYLTNLRHACAANVRHKATSTQVRHRKETLCGFFSAGDYSVKTLTGTIRQIEHTDEGTTTWTTLSAKARTDGGVSEGGHAER